MSRSAAEGDVAALASKQHSPGAERQSARSSALREGSNAMVSFRTTYGSQVQGVTHLTRLLAGQGATESLEPDQPDVRILGASTVDEAVQVLEQVPATDRANALIVGLPGTLDIREPPRVGTLAGLLEHYRPLGILAVCEAWNPDLAGFIGPKALADIMDAGFLKQHSSSHYATWLRCIGTDAGDFVLRLLRASQTGA
jgi:hypothetical protein